MKYLFACCKSLLLFFIATTFQGCLKDSSTKTYSLYKPVYQSVTEVRANIKSGAPTPITSPGKIFVLGNFIFLNEVDKGVHVIDNTNPSAPVNKNFISIPGNLDLAVKGNILYADLYRDLVTIDISNPNSVKLKKITENVFPARSYTNGFVADSNQVIVDWIKKDTTVTTGNVNAFPMPGGVVYYDMAASNFSGSAAPIGVSGSMARFTLLNSYLYTVTNNNLNVFNISQPENPVFANSINVGWNIQTLYPFKQNLFVGSMSGMFIFNTANPAQPTMLSQFQHLTACDPVIADDKFAYVTLRAGTACNGTSINQLEVLNIENLQQPYLLKSYPLTNPQGLSKSGTTLFVCDGPGGLKVFDAKNSLQLTQLQSVEGINASDVIALNNNAIVVGSDGIYQYDYSDPANLKLRSKIK